MGQAQGCVGFQDSQLGCFGPFLVWSLSLTATGLCIAGIMNNQLSTRYESGNSEPISYCGFRDEWELNNQFFRAVKYQYFCYNVEAVPEGKLSTDYCQTASCGVAWLVLSIAAAMLGIGTILFTLVSCVKYEDGYQQGFSVCKKFLELFACILSISAIVGWFFNNDICWDELDRDNDLIEVGSSIWFMAGAAGCFMLACICRFI